MQETQETRVQSLGREDPLEEEMATHSSILGWKILWTEEPSGLQSMGLQRVRHNSNLACMQDSSGSMECVFIFENVFSIMGTSLFKKTAWGNKNNSIKHGV